MAPVASVRNELVLDTSWLLELYRVPGHSTELRNGEARSEMELALQNRLRIWVTVPVLFEVSNHIVHVPDGSVRRSLSEVFLGHVKSSIDRDMRWTLPTVDKEILFRSSDLIALADRFLQTAGRDYSFADISIIDLAEKLRKKNSNVRILAYDRQLEAYSD